MSSLNKKLPVFMLATMLSGSYALAGGGEEPPFEISTQPSTKMVEKPAETEGTHDRGAQVSTLKDEANEDDSSIEELQKKLAEMKQQNDARELERQQEEKKLKKEQEQKREELLRQIAEEEKRQKELQKPVQIAQEEKAKAFADKAIEEALKGFEKKTQPIQVAKEEIQKNLADLSADFVTNGIKSLKGNGTPSHVNEKGEYVPSDFVQTREALKGSFRNFFK